MMMYMNTTTALKQQLLSIPSARTSHIQLSLGTWQLSLASCNQMASCRVELVQHNLHTPTTGHGRALLQTFYMG